MNTTDYSSLGRTDKAPADSPAGLLSIAYQNRDRHATDHEAMDAIVMLRERLSIQESRIVFALRLRGASWREIATAAGLASEEEAWARFDMSAGLLDRLAACRGLL